MVNNRPYGQNPPTPAQLLAARAGLGLSAQALAQEAGLGVNTVRRAEADGPGVLTPANAGLLIAALERRGVVFLADEGSGPGVRFGAAED